jgi:hypothetical protein
MEIAGTFTLHLIRISRKCLGASARMNRDGIGINLSQKNMTSLQIYSLSYNGAKKEKMVPK